MKLSWQIWQRAIFSTHNHQLSMLLQIICPQRKKKPSWEERELLQLSSIPSSCLVTGVTGLEVKNLKNAALYSPAWSVPFIRRCNDLTHFDDWLLWQKMCASFAHADDRSHLLYNFFSILPRYFLAFYPSLLPCSFRCSDWRGRQVCLDNCRHSPEKRPEMDVGFGLRPDKCYSKLVES